MAQHHSTDGSSIVPDGSTNTGSRSRSATAQPSPSAPRPLGTLRSTQDGTSTGPAASIGAVANRGKVTDNKPSSTSSAAAFTPSARPAPRKLNFKAKVVARSAEVSTVKAEAHPVPTALSSSHVNGTSSVRGRGRGTIPPEATASGPFALGPSESRRLGRNAPVRFSTSNRDSAPSFATTGASGGSSAVLPRLHLAGVEIASNSKEEKEEYSDPEDPEMGRVDISDIAELDWMAPEALRKIERPKTQRNAVGFLKSERFDGVGSGLYPDISTSEKTATEDARGEDVTNDFIPMYCEGQEALDTRDSALYFFQFPTPFPSFLPILSHSGRNHSESPDSVPMDIHSNRQDATVSTNPLADARHTLKRPKTVTFASETKAPMPVTEAEAPVLDGVIGQLDVYRSGAVKMRLGNGTVLEVTAGTQPTFLQHAVHLEVNDDGENRSGMTVLGGVNRRFVVSPDVESLLGAMETAGSKDNQLTCESELMEADSA